jgi:signal peptidase I
MNEFYTESFPDPEESESRGGFVRFVIDVLETILLSLLLFLAINAISARIRVDGFSMEPSLHSGEYVIVNKVTYYLDEPERGDIIVFHFPRQPDQEYIKRVIGLPGDQVRISDGSVYVNDRRLDEPYINADPAYGGTWTVPEDQFFVLGDNRNNSSDSHDWGFVPFEFVIGKAVFVYWPPTQWGIIEHPTQVFAAP